MTAAELVEASDVPLQFAVGGTLYGAGQPWHNDLAGWSIFGVGVKDQDVNLELEDGERATNDKLTSRVCAFPLSSVGAEWSQAEQEAALFALEADWAPRPQDVELHFRLASGHYYVIGRPRGVVVDASHLAAVDGDESYVSALLTFKALKPTIYPYEGS